MDWCVESQIPKDELLKFSFIYLRFCTQFNPNGTIHLSGGKNTPFALIKVTDRSWTQFIFKINFNLAILHNWSRIRFAECIKFLSLLINKHNSGLVIFNMDINKTHRTESPHNRGTSHVRLYPCVQANYPAVKKYFLFCFSEVMW